MWPQREFDIKLADASINVQEFENYGRKQQLMSGTSEKLKTGHNWSSKNFQFRKSDDRFSIKIQGWRNKTLMRVAKNFDGACHFTKEEVWFTWDFLKKIKKKYLIILLIQYKSKKK